MSDEYRPEAVIDILRVQLDMVKAELHAARERQAELEKLIEAMAPAVAGWRVSSGCKCDLCLSGRALKRYRLRTKSDTPVEGA